MGDVSYFLVLFLYSHILPSFSSSPLPCQFVVVDTASLNSQGAAAEGKPLLLYLTRNVVVCSIVKLLRVIAVDGFR